MAIEILQYDPAWTAQAARASSQLIEALPGVLRQIEHVGSTSVPGLAAKPIIDLMASVTALADVATEEEAELAQLGYESGETGMRNRLFYCRVDDRGRRSHHLHIVTTDTWDTRNERLFRDYLLRHPEVAGEYGAVKQRLATEGAEGLAYTRAKTDLIQRVVDSERTARGLPLEPVWEE